MPAPSFRISENELDVVVKVSFQGLADASMLDCFLNEMSLSVNDGSNRFTAISIPLPQYPTGAQIPGSRNASWKDGGFKAKFSKKRAELTVTLPKPKTETVKPPPPPIQPETDAVTLAVDPVTEASLTAAARAEELPPSLAKVERFRATIRGLQEKQANLRARSDDFLSHCESDAAAAAADASTPRLVGNEEATPATDLPTAPSPAAAEPPTSFWEKRREETMQAHAVAGEEDALAPLVAASNAMPASVGDAPLALLPLVSAQSSSACLLPPPSSSPLRVFEEEVLFTSCGAFMGSKPGCVFKLGQRGLGYYSEGRGASEERGEGYKGIGCGIGAGGIIVEPLPVSHSLSSSSSTSTTSSKTTSSVGAVMSLQLSLSSSPPLAQRNGGIHNEGDEEEEHGCTGGGGGESLQEALLRAATFSASSSSSSTASNPSLPSSDSASSSSPRSFSEAAAADFLLKWQPPPFAAATPGSSLTSSQRTANLFTAAARAFGGTDDGDEDRTPQGERGRGGAREAESMQRFSDCVMEWTANRPTSSSTSASTPPSSSPEAMHAAASLGVCCAECATAPEKSVAVAGLLTSGFIKDGRARLAFTDAFSLAFTSKFGAPTAALLFSPASTATMDGRGQWAGEERGGGGGALLSATRGRGGGRVTKTAGASPSASVSSSSSRANAPTPESAMLAMTSPAAAAPGAGFAQPADATAEALLLRATSSRSLALGRNAGKDQDQDQDEDPATRVLNYVCAHGHLPPEDDDDDENDGGDDGGNDGGNLAALFPAMGAFSNGGEDSASHRVTRVPRGKGARSTYESTSGVKGGGGSQWGSTCPKRAPLATVVDDFMSAAKFAALSNAVESHPRCHTAESEALGKGFAGTKGFICRFNSVGASEELGRHKDTSSLAPFFEAVRDHTCNAFVLNVLLCDPTAAATADTTTTSTNRSAPTTTDPSAAAARAGPVPVPAAAAAGAAAAASVDWHRDATLGLVGWASDAGVSPQLAHVVSVLYLHTPDDDDDDDEDDGEENGARGKEEDEKSNGAGDDDDEDDDDDDDDDGSANGASTWSRMRGGRLLLRHPKRPPRHAELRQRQLKQRGQLGEDEDCVVDLAVRPVKNRLVHFRGDAEHCVEAFATSGGSGGGSVLAGRRVSLVLEQYRVPPGHFDFTTRFELVDPKDYLRCFKD